MSSWPSINPADLRHEIQIQSQTSARDAFGQPQAVWATVLDCFARIQIVSDSEQFAAGQLSSQVTHTVTIRWTGDAIAAGMQVVFGSRKFHIQAINNVDERNVLLKLLCLELG